MTVVLVAASVEVKIELTESTAPAAIKMLKVRIAIPPNNFLYRAVERPTINVGRHSQFPTPFRGRIERFSRMKRPVGKRASSLLLRSEANGKNFDERGQGSASAISA